MKKIMCTYGFVYVCIHPPIHTYIHTSIHIHKEIPAKTYIYISTQTQKKFMCMCMYVHTHPYIHTYIHMHKNKTQTKKQCVVLLPSTFFKGGPCPQSKRKREYLFSKIEIKLKTKSISKAGQKKYCTFFKSNSKPKQFCNT